MVGALAIAEMAFEPFVGEAPRVKLTGDAALARAAAHGDRDAFGRLVDEHKRSVYGLCVRILGDREEAKDAAQEAFVRAWAALTSYDVARPFAPWLLGIARNHCLDVTRRRPRTERSGEDDPEPADTAAVPTDEALAARETAGALHAAVAALPARYREVIQLFHVQHLSYKEIALVLGVPMGTVMTWLHRARAQLREALREEAVS